MQFIALRNCIQNAYTYALEDLGTWDVSAPTAEKIVNKLFIS